MALTTAQEVRLRIQDFPRVADDTYIGDGSAAIFNVPHRNLTSATAYVMITSPTTGWSATGCTFNASGYVSFSGVLSANSAWRARYVYSVFSDEEVDHRISARGSVNGAALDFVQDLMFDGLRRAAWVAPDGSEYDDTKAMGLLKDLYAALKQEQVQDAVGAGGFAEWSITQDD